MAVTKQFTQLDPINNGTTAADNFKLSDAIPAQHTDLTGGVNKLVHRTLAQSLCEPVAVCNSNNPSNGAYTANCSNYPDFALSYQDAQQNTHYLIGLKIRVIFTYGITYGSVSGGTYPTLNINGSGAIPMLAQGKTMASGAASAGQSIEFTIIPYGNGVAFDADSNVRESTSDYTIYTDGLKRVDSVEDDNMNMTTSNAVFNEFLNYAKTNKIALNGGEKKLIVKGSNEPFCLLIVLRGRSPNAVSYALYSGYVPSLAATTRTNLTKLFDDNSNITNNGDQITITSPNSQTYVSITVLLGSYTYTLENVS